MRFFIPLVHRVKLGIGLMNDPHRRFGDGHQIVVGYDHRQFDDALALGIKAGHFHVQPNEMIRVLCHIICPVSSIPHSVTA